MSEGWELRRPPLPGFQDVGQALSPTVVTDPSGLARGDGLVAATAVGLSVGPLGPAVSNPP